MSFPYHSIVPQNDDEKFMLEALKEAWKAFKANEVPVGAVLVKDGRILARGHNQMEMLRDATAHAEMLCLTCRLLSAGKLAASRYNSILYCRALCDVRRSHVVGPLADIGLGGSGYPTWSQRQLDQFI